MADLSMLYSALNETKIPDGGNEAVRVVAETDKMDVDVDRGGRSVSSRCWSEGCVSRVPSCRTCAIRTAPT